MDLPEVAINAIHPLTVESENDGLILPTVSPTPTVDPMPVVEDDTCGEMLEGQNDLERVYSGLSEGGNLQVRFLLSHLMRCLTIEFF
jgi:hypothetical protein